MNELAKEAAMQPLRELVENGQDVEELNMEEIRGANLQDFKKSLESILPTVNQGDLTRYMDWNKQYGSYQTTDEELNN